MFGVIMFNGLTPYQS